MNRIKKYLINQASRGVSMLTYDFVIIGGFLCCVYYGFIR
jgi:hypothetical protein